MSLKKKITQNDLRKAMSEHKKKFSGIKKIESPLAKYTDSGQLMCILCKSLVRSESAWVVHLNSKSHKENVELAKKTKFESIQMPKSHMTSKRPQSPVQESLQIKKLKSTENQDISQVKTHTNLPADFFDNTPVRNIFSLKIKKMETMETVVKDNTENAVKVDDNKKEKDSSLPEGFFDDPILDAKVRNVEYKDPIEEEWERFQKEMKEETAQSAQIIAEDQEEATTERQLDEIEEQIRNWSRVMDLVKLKESVHRDERKQDSTFDDMSSTEEIEYDEEMDWRAKKSKK